MPEDLYAYVVAAFQAPPSPDYMPGPEEPQSPPLLYFVPEPIYPEYVPLEDEILLAEEQPLPAAASPTADSPGYVPESDPEEEPEADDNEDPEEDPADCEDARKRLSIAFGPRYETGESSAAAVARPIGGRRADYGFVDTIDAEIRRRGAEDVGYGIRDTWVDPREADEEIALTTLEGVNTRVTEFAAVQEQDTHNIYGVIEDTQTDIPES
ncbi:hypothetical protein Tco_1322162 [Tanacetum coccineum]